MLNENPGDKFYGCNANLTDKVEQIQSILLADSSKEKIEDCLAAMAAYARWDLMSTLQITSDIAGLEDIVFDGLITGLDSADLFTGSAE